MFEKFLRYTGWKSCVVAGRSLLVEHARREKVEKGAREQEDE